MLSFLYCKIMLNKTLEKTLLWIIYLGSLAIVFVPLIIVPYSYFPYIMIKMIILRTIIEVVFLSWLVLMLYKPEYRPQRTSLFYLVSGFLVVWLLATLFSSSFIKSFWGNYERMGGFFNYLHYYLWFIVLIGVLKNIKHWYRLLLGSLIASVLICLYSLVQRLGLGITFQSGLARVNGTIGNAAYLAAYTLIHAFIALYFYIKSNKLYLKILYFLSFLLLLLVMFMTSTRGAALGFFISIVLFFIFSLIFKFYKEKKARLLVIFSGLIILFSLFILLFNNSSIITENSVLKRFHNVSFTDNTIQTRLISWKAGTQAFHNNLIFGVGPENYNVAFNQYFTPDFYLYTGSEVWFDRAHNTLVDMMAMLGIFGILGYLSLFAFILYIIYQFYKKQGFAMNMVILSLLFIAYFVQNIFVFDSMNTFIIFFMLLAFVDFLDRLNKNKVKSEEKVTKFSKIPPVIFLVLIIIIFISSVFGIQLKQVKANRFTYDGFLAQNNPLNTSNPKEGFNEFYNNLKNAIEIAINPIDPINILTQGMSDMVAKYSELIDHDFLNNAYLDTIKLGEKAIELDPKNVYNYLLLSKIYNSYAEFSRDSLYLNKNIDLLTEAKKLSPSRVRLYWSEAQTYLIAGEYDKAIDLMNQSIDLVEGIADSHWSLYLIYSNLGRFEEAKVSAEKAVKYDMYLTKPGDIKNLVALLQDSAENKVLEKLYHRAVGVSPEVFGYYERAFPVYMDLVPKYKEENPEYKERGLYIFNIGLNKLPEENKEQILYWISQLESL